MVLRVNKFLKINIDVTFDSTFSVTSHFNPSVGTVESTLKIYSKLNDLIIHKSGYVILCTKYAHGFSSGIQQYLKSLPWPCIIWFQMTSLISGPFQSFLTHSVLAHWLSSCWTQTSQVDSCFRPGTLLSCLFSHCSLLKFIKILVEMSYSLEVLPVSFTYNRNPFASLLSPKAAWFFIIALFTTWNYVNSV